MQNYLNFFAVLLIYLPNWLKPGDSKVAFAVFKSSCHLYYWSNHSKAEAIPLSALLKDTTNELVGLSSHYFFNAERQAVKL